MDPYLAKLIGRTHTTDSADERIVAAGAKLQDLDARLAKQCERLWSEREKRRLDAWSKVFDKIDQLRQRGAL